MSYFLSNTGYMCDALLPFTQRMDDVLLHSEGLLSELLDTNVHQIQMLKTIINEVNRLLTRIPHKERATC